MHIQITDFGTAKQLPSDSKQGIITVLISFMLLVVKYDQHKYSLNWPQETEHKFQKSAVINITGSKWIQYIHKVHLFMLLTDL